MKKITPFLWFDGNAEEAMRFYTSIFPNSRTTNIMRTAPKGPVLSVSFELDGQESIAPNGGPSFTFTPAVSFFIACKTPKRAQRVMDAMLQMEKLDIARLRQAYEAQAA